MGWIRVLEGVGEKMLVENGDIWVTRKNCFGDRWVQKIFYHIGQAAFDWDGIVAWMPNQSEKPNPCLTF